MSSPAARGRGRGRGQARAELLNSSTGPRINQAVDFAHSTQEVVDLTESIDSLKVSSGENPKQNRPKREERKPFSSRKDLYNNPQDIQTNGTTEGNGDRKPFPSARQLYSQSGDQRSNGHHEPRTDNFRSSIQHDDRDSEQYNYDDHSSGKRLGRRNGGGGGRNSSRQGNQNFNKAWSAENQASDSGFKFDSSQVKQEAPANSRPPQKFPKRNTETFVPSHEPSQMRILTAPAGLRCYNREYQSRDVLIVNDLYLTDVNDLTIYQKLLKETENCGVSSDDLWKLWHGDSHLIADDKTKWKRQCPTFNFVLDRIKEYFKMDIKATRFNWYRNSKEWKPFHHDAAAVKPDKAEQQNFTVAVSFGAERDVSFVCLLVSFFV